MEWNDGMERWNGMDWNGTIDGMRMRDCITLSMHGLASFCQEARGADARFVSSVNDRVGYHHGLHW